MHNQYTIRVQHMYMFICSFFAFVSVCLYYVFLLVVRDAVHYSRRYYFKHEPDKVERKHDNTEAAKTFKENKVYHKRNYIGIPQESKLDVSLKPKKEKKTKKNNNPQSNESNENNKENNESHIPTHDENEEQVGENEKINEEVDNRLSEDEEERGEERLDEEKEHQEKTNVTERSSKAKQNVGVKRKNKAGEEGAANGRGKRQTRNS